MGKTFLKQISFRNSKGISFTDMKVFRVFVKNWSFECLSFEIDANSLRNCDLTTYVLHIRLYVNILYNNGFVFVWSSAFFPNVPLHARQVITAVLYFYAISISFTFVKNTTFRPQFVVLVIMLCKYSLYLLLDIRIKSNFNQ